MRSRLCALMALALGIAAACEDATGPRTGSIQVSLTTTGDELDPDGYRILLESGKNVSIGLAGSVSLPELEPGSYVVRLDGLAQNCRTVEENPRIVMVAVGEVVSIGFTVVCYRYTGSVRVRLNSDGAQPDADGYQLAVTQALGAGTNLVRSVGSNQSVTIEKLAEGPYHVELRDVARNCVIDDMYWQSVMVTPGGTAEVAFQVHCEPPGNLRITATTTGVDPDLGGYTLRVIGERFDSTMALSGTRLDLAGLAAVPVTVTLGAVSSNCRVAESNSRVVPLSAGHTSNVDFQVACTRSPGRLAMVLASSLDIYAWDVGDLVPTRLTFTTASEGQPAWSPDGTRIAFTSNRHGNVELYVMNLDGSNVVRLTEQIGEDVRPVWSPDGERIAFESNRDGDFEIYTMKADGSDVRQLTRNSLYDGQPSWSSDGRIAFIRVNETDLHSLNVMNADGSGASTVILAYFASDPSWSPDASRIAFSRDVVCEPKRMCYADIFLINADGSGLQRLNTGFTPTSHHVQSSWSADGNRIAFSAQTCSLDYYYYYYFGCSVGGIAVLNLAGGLSHVVNGFYSPSWR